MLAPSEDIEALCVHLEGKAIMTRSHFTALIAATLLLAAGCDPGTDINDPASNTAQEGQGNNGGEGGEGTTTAPPNYIALTIADVPEHSCANSGAHGADIDTAELLDATTLLRLSRPVQVAGTPGDGTPVCSLAADDRYQGLGTLMGPPNGDNFGGIVALAGGYVTLAFEQPLTPGLAVRVFEIGKADPYVVGMVTRMDCEPGDDSCYLEIGTFQGEDPIAIPNF